MIGIRLAIWGYPFPKRLSVVESVARRYLNEHVYRQQHEHDKWTTVKAREHAQYVSRSSRRVMVS